MYLYESKKPDVSAKAVAPDKRKRTVSNKCSNFASSDFRFSSSMSGYILQRAATLTAETPKANHPPAGSARLPYDVPLNFHKDLEFIEMVLSNNDWKALIERDGTLHLRAKQILEDWDRFLPRFLEYYGFVSYGANQSHTYHRAGNNNATEHYGEAGSKIEATYNNSNGIRECREYTEDEEIKRYLRHCAAALAINFGIEDEIQCYYDDKVVYVAANNGVGSDISQINNTKVSECSSILQHPWSTLIELPVDNDNSIWGGFHDKLVKLVTSSDCKPQPLLDKLKHGVSCPSSLTDTTFQVIANTYKIQGFHAERQILYYLRDSKGKQDIFLDPLRLGGIRRPCFTCSALCFANMSQVHAGPVWVSDAASRPKDIKEMFLILEAIRNKNNTTHITLDINGHLTTNYDTESNGG